MVSLTLSPRIRRSPFYAATLAAGVTDFTVYNKMLMPTSYGDLSAEYRRLLEGVAVWDVACQRQVEISGPDADRLVQRLVARDVSRMDHGDARYVAMCDHDGVLLNDPVLLRLHDRWWLSLADSDMLLWVKAVALEAGFETDVSEPDVSPLAVQGPLAEDVVAELFGDEVRNIRRFRFNETELDGIPLVVCRSGWSAQGGFELFLRDGSAGGRLWDLVTTAGEQYGIGPGAPNHVERVESGLLSFGGDTTPGSNPFECGMERFVDLETPDEYIGRPALRMIAKEGPDRLLMGLVFEDDVSDTWPVSGRQPLLADGRVVGTASAIVRSPRLGTTIGLAQISASHATDGSRVGLADPPVEAKVTRLPFL